MPFEISSLTIYLRSNFNIEDAWKASGLLTYGLLPNNRTWWDLPVVGGCYITIARRLPFSKGREIHIREARQRGKLPLLNTFPASRLRCVLQQKRVFVPICRMWCARTTCQEASSREHLTEIHLEKPHPLLRLLREHVRLCCSIGIEQAGLFNRCAVGSSRQNLQFKGKASSPSERSRPVLTSATLLSGRGPGVLSHSLQKEPHSNNLTPFLVWRISCNGALHKFTEQRLTSQLRHETTGTEDTCQPTIPRSKRGASGSTHQCPVVGGDLGLLL